MRSAKLWCLLILSAMAVVPMRAADQRPFPAFEVTAPGGAAVSSLQLSAERRWLVLYVTPGCLSCDQLLSALKEWHSPQLAGRTIVMVRASREQAGEYIGAHLPAEAADVPWYADTASAAWQALALTGSPVLVGIEAGEIKWMVSGVLNDARALEPVVRSWVEY